MLVFGEMLVFGDARLLVRLVFSARSVECRHLLLLVLEVPLAQIRYRYRFMKAVSF
jgi:hypothetical protein